ncbi:MAG: methyltransferase domain-containing protein [Alphaproteobacteria bacterium]|nr:methyltransferase domain-containing protein [Alphaproteobacteria bacterium]
MFSTYLNFIWRSLRHPASCPADTGLWRRFLLKARVHDFVSTLLQLRDMYRMQALSGESGSSTVAGDESKRVVSETIQHNLGQLRRKLVSSTRRVEIYYQVLTTPWRDLSQERLLVIGGRNFHELWVAKLYGYSWENIEAIDLFATNPKIRVMNMEALEYADERFDAITMINTLGYAIDPLATIAGIARILRPGGRFVFNHVYDPGADTFGKADRVSGAAVLEALKRAGLGVYFYIPVDKTNAHGRRQTSHLFGARKHDPAQKPLDQLKI